MLPLFFQSIPIYLSFSLSTSRHIVFSIVSSLSLIGNRLCDKRYKSRDAWEKKINTFQLCIYMNEYIAPNNKDAAHRIPINIA